MKIRLAKTSGFCFGVKRALQIALHTAKSRGEVYLLGDIVHNEDAVRAITRSGIKKIQQLTRGKNKILLIRAHGASLKTFTRARYLGYRIVDATCPMVKEIHRIAQEMEQKGYRVIVIGDKRHEEVLGIIGQLKQKALVIDPAKNIPALRAKKAALVVQSTQNIDRVLPIVEILKTKIKDFRFFNTVCQPTRSKQAEIRKMPLENELMIIIGSRTSANTGRLFEIAKSLNPRSYWIQSKGELRRSWFKGIKTVGIAAGASTPDQTTQDVIRQIRSYG